MPIKIKAPGFQLLILFFLYFKKKFQFKKSWKFYIVLWDVADSSITSKS